MNKIYIKNMVCPRCVVTVKGILNDLDIKFTSVDLGETELADNITETEKNQLHDRLHDHGFELLKDQKSKLIERIKAIVIEQIHYSRENLKVNFSTLLSEKLNHEYSSLSRLFSSVEGITIERYILKQKIEKVKEHIIYNELTLSEIAFQMGYSSVAHLSAQFKKETGMTTSEFKKLKKPSRKSLDNL